MKPSRSSAGRTGGNTTFKRHGQEHYKRIGAIGGRKKRKSRVKGPTPA